MSDADDSAEDDQERQQQLHGMNDADKQALVNRALDAEDAADRLTHMLEGGPPARMLGEPHPAVLAERLEVRALSCTHLALRRVSGKSGLP